MTKDKLRLLIKGEGDYQEWVNKNITCFIRRNYAGSWCGYIKVPFPLDGDVYLDCHGGVTYQVTNDDNTTLGFDCSHSFDISPYLYLEDGFQTSSEYRVYRDKEFVISEVNSMVNQVLEITSVRRSINIDNILDSD